MSGSSRLVALNTGRSQHLHWVAGLAVATIFALLVPPTGTTSADNQQYSVVARVDAKSAGLIRNEIVVRVGNMRVPAAAIHASPDIPRHIAIVVDAGPNQANALLKEKKLAIALMDELSDASTSFSIIRAGISSKTEAATSDRSLATESIRGMAGDLGKNANIPVYDAIGSAIRQISLTPGLHIAIFIGEGNDGGSILRYTELRSLAESNQVAFFAVLVADHNLRGTKSILRYGWNLRELTSGTAGIFLENPKMQTATRRLRESVRGLRLVTFEMASSPSGRYKISVSSNRNQRFKSQKAIVIP
jgi:hypothetical protein